MTAKQFKFGLGIAVVAGCVVMLVVSGFNETSMYYFTVAELEAREAEFVGRKIKLAGKVVPGSIRKDDVTLDLRFEIWEPVEGAVVASAHRKPIYYTGIVPDTFRDEADVILEGITGKDGVFEADHLLAKCPSKYESKSYGEMKAMHAEGDAVKKL
jgi:cytochrome c-type biogenesis protein CcmE